MALYTQFHGTAKFQIRLKNGAVGIMTGHASHDLAVPFIDHAGTDRMGKGPLGFMTTAASCITVILEHHRIVRTMGRVAIAAHFRVRMFVGLIDINIPGVAMTLSANLALPVAQHIVEVGGMGTVTINAAIPPLAGQMTMDGAEFLPNLIMTLKTFFHPGYSSIIVAGAAIILIRSMENFSHQAGAVAAMGIMTGQTSLLLDFIGEFFMGRLNVRAMAGNT